MIKISNKERLTSSEEQSADAFDVGTVVTDKDGDLFIVTDENEFVFLHSADGLTGEPGSVCSIELEGVRVVDIEITIK